VKIRFETTIDDIVAFNRFHLGNSPAWRKQVWTQMLIVPAILSGLVVLGALRQDNRDDGLPFLLITGIPVLVVSLLWAFGIRWWLHWSLGRNTRKFWAEGSNRALTGWREMELADGRLIIKTELLYASLDLRAIEKIVNTDNYTYVYIGATNAYMIPMNLYPEDEYREFVGELIDAWDQREAPRPVDEPRRSEADVGIQERR
jgi:hypothetical protein